MKAERVELVEQAAEQRSGPTGDKRRQLDDAAWQAAAEQAERVEQARAAVSDAVADLPPVAPVDLINRTSDNRVVLADDVSAIRLTPSYDGYLDVVMHGDATGTQAAVNGERIDFTAEQTAQLIESTRSWDQRPVRLLSCSTGQEQYAQELADRLDVPVYAPSDILNVLPDGTTFVDGKDGWRRFEPGRR